MYEVRTLDERHKLLYTTTDRLEAERFARDRARTDVVVVPFGDPERMFRLPAPEPRLERALRLEEKAHALFAEAQALRECTHNEMVETGDPAYAWACAVCGYVYGKASGLAGEASGLAPCVACAEHYGDDGVCDEGKPLASPHRKAR